MKLNPKADLLHSRRRNRSALHQIPSPFPTVNKFASSSRQSNSSSSPTSPVFLRVGCQQDAGKNASHLFTHSDQGGGRSLSKVDCFKAVVIRFPRRPHPHDKRPWFLVDFIVLPTNSRSRHSSNIAEEYIGRMRQ